MTNPNNAVGTNGAYGGRTSVEAFNDVMNILSRGIISGWECVPNSGLTVSLGGSGTVRDVAVAEDAAGNKTSVNNRSGLPIDITIAPAPASNTRIDAIVAYVESSPTGSDTITDNPEPCGIISVAGTPSSSPSAPNDSAIRTAITADGASGTTAFYVVLAYITIPSGTTDLTADNITAGPRVQTGAKITADNIDFTTFSLSKTSLTATISGSGTPSISTQKIWSEVNANNILGKIYGRIDISKTGASTITISISDTGLRPSTQTTIGGACIFSPYDNTYHTITINMVDLTINTDGTASITLNSPANEVGGQLIIIPQLLFI